MEDILVMIYLNIMTLFQEPGLDQEETQWPGRDHALGEDPGNINNYSNIRENSHLYICYHRFVKFQTVVLLLNVL